MSSYILQRTQCPVHVVVNSQDGVPPIRSWFIVYSHSKYRFEHNHTHPLSMSEFGILQQLCQQWEPPRPQTRSAPTEPRSPTTISPKSWRPRTNGSPNARASAGDTSWRTRKRWRDLVVLGERENTSQLEERNTGLVGLVGLVSY